MANMQLTWWGFESAVDIIGAQCGRGRPGIYGASHIGQFLAVAIGYRLNLPVLRNPIDGMLVVDGVAGDMTFANKYEKFDAELWVWVDQTPQKAYNSVMTTDSGVKIYLPWEDPMVSTSCSETFVSGFHD